MTECTKNGETIKQEEEYLPTDPIENPAWIGVTAGATIGLGNFSSGRISVSITYPCNPGDVDSVYPKLKDWVDRRVSKEVQELREVSNQNKSNRYDV